MKSTAHYVIRLDDICPTMNWQNFKHLEHIFQQFNIKPIIGIVPDNQDPKLNYQAPHANFWPLMKELATQGWIIAQHGYQHIYQPHIKSEFTGLSAKQQHQQISQGQAILKANLGFQPTWWMAPAHNFDTTTCLVLNDLGFTHITDGIALYPFSKHGLTWVPQQLWQPVAMPFGTWTICLHPNTMSATNIDHLEKFIKQHPAQFSHISHTPRTSPLNPLFAIAWHTVRFLKKLLP